MTRPETIVAVLLLRPPLRIMLLLLAVPYLLVGFVYAVLFADDSERGAEACLAAWRGAWAWPKRR